MKNHQISVISHLVLAQQLAISKDLPASRTWMIVDNVGRLHVLVDVNASLLLSRTQIAAVKVTGEVHKMHINLVPSQLRAVLVGFSTNVAHVDLRRHPALLRTPLHLHHL